MEVRTVISKKTSGQNCSRKAIKSSAAYFIFYFSLFLLKNEHSAGHTLLDCCNFELSLMAASGALRLSFSFTTPSNDSKTLPKTLSFTFSQLCGDKISSMITHRRTISTDRCPKIVSPRAVSDSKNSQTCLDPDASRVSLFFLLISFTSVCEFGRFCMVACD